MKNLDVLSINQLLTSTDFNSIANGKSQYAIQKNVNRLEPEVKLLQMKAIFKLIGE